MSRNASIAAMLYAAVGLFGGSWGVRRMLTADTLVVNEILSNLLMDACVTVLRDAAPGPFGLS